MIQLHNEDCLELLHSVPDNSVDMITPPFLNVLDGISCNPNKTEPCQY